MEKFIIKKIEADFDERWLRVKKIDDGKEFGIYFMEFSEDVFMMNNISMKRKVGDIIEGNLFIAWITEFERTDKELMYVQKNEYSGIDAVVEITEVINEFTYYAKNSIVDDLDYWKIGKDNAIISFPLEKRLGLSEETFENSAEGFKNFTEQAERVIKEAKKNKNVRNVNGKLFYYIDGADKIKKVSQLYLKMVDFSQ